MPTLGDNCPRCGMPTYVGGICTHDDCNYPASESNNARKKRQADEAWEKKRKKEAEAKAKSGAGGKKPETKSGLIDWIGMALALVAAVVAFGLVAERIPEPPWLRFVAAMGAGALVYALRALIVVGGTVIFIVYLIATNNS